ncbi:MAG: CAP domain-containing protein [Pseudomonadota bacterium]
MSINFMFRIGIVLILFISSAFGAELNDCGNNEKARFLVKLIKADKEQKRSDIRCNRILTAAAEAKARRMAEFGLVIHNLGGSPNSRLKEAGYELPNHYGHKFDSNQVEAIAGGYANANEVWEAFKESKGHRTHLLGEHEFYIKQDEIGVGFVKEWKSPHVEYWVVYLTKGYKKNQSYADTDIPNKK